MNSPAGKPPSKLRIGIVGAGRAVRERHLPHLQRLSEVEVRAVCNSSYESAQQFCVDYLPQATPLQDWADLIASEELDAIWIGTPPYLHSSVTLSALEAGKHVFCQGRMAMNLAEAEEMLAVARRHPELVTMLCPPPQGLRGDLFVRKVLAEEQLGTIHQVRLRSLNAAYLDPHAPAHWRQRDEFSGYNVLSLGIYAEVLQRWLGPVRSLSAHARGVHAERAGYHVHVPDLVHVLCTFASGCEGVLSFSGVAAHAPGDRVELYGTEGTLVYDFDRDEVLLGTRQERGLTRQEIPANLTVTWRVEEDFVYAVRSRGQLRPKPDFADGVQSMRVVQAVADALNLRQEVRIDGGLERAPSPDPTA